MLMMPSSLPSAHSHRKSKIAERNSPVFRFTIRDVLWLTLVVAVTIVLLMDRSAVRRERAELAKREAEHISRAKMWEAEANRAEERQAETMDELTRLSLSLKREEMLRRFKTEQEAVRKVLESANGSR